MTTKLNQELVNKIFTESLFENSVSTDIPVVVEGITCTVGFNPTRLEKYKEQIQEMLKDLPTEFQKNSGGGMSFLNACNDKNGEQWTGVHQRMEQLFQLGIAIGKIKLLMPREFWSILPGGMPYYVILS